MRIIKVTGTGNIRLKPDLMRLYITLSGREKEYARALERSSADTEKLRTLFDGLGFAREDLKTLSFTNDPAYEGYEDKHGNWRQKLVGYEFRHQLKLEFSFDNERLGKILKKLSAVGLTPEFSIGYAVKDTEAAKNELIAAAVADARKKAEILAGAADLALGEIQTIDYSISRPEMEVVTMRKMTFGAAMDAAAEETFSPNIQPDDITANDTVTVTWEIR